ncbi:glycosyltransferase [Chroogloeocystis siderophila]|jgi:colanic acid/amylovoran biosynthesis glycosyltransferase|uniref:Colanic acid biosynthesis glycosyltransferase WcaL n=1 Tax=Chroogloeocystis siderophila 5.2 s.c.1 TaxID=247279 RepID=A0A1U7HYT6_9CHRO|nr:glycosyltransferase [Chroogloeocystis siderophila]OKH28818.1 colanic acid biosynthesis glycosyltransferase WcaL [Chroogloeocystis siderophila 5.2 s.c.1]
MRIAFIVGIFPLLSETFVLNQITGLIDRGHEVDIYALRHPLSNCKMHPHVEKYNLLARTHYTPAIPSNVFWRYLKGFALLFTNFHKAPLICLRSLNFFKYGGAATSLKILYTAIPMLGQKPYDIIHCQFGCYALEILTLRDIGALQGKIVTSFRGWDISRYVKQYGDRVYDRLLATGDLFLPVCDFFRTWLVKHGGDSKRIITHRSGIDCNKFFFTPRYLNSDDSIQIVTVGRLVEKKGIKYSIEAVAQLSQTYKNIHYYIIGDGELKEELQRLIHAFGISHIVTLLGRKNQQEIIEILTNSHIFVAPSVTAQDGNQEGIPNTLKEAMAMGLPVVATRHSGIPELIEDSVSGFLVPERDADAIAQKLSYLIKHPETWADIGLAARKSVEAQYEIQKLNNELVDLYQKLLADKSVTYLPSGKSYYKVA